MFNDDEYTSEDRAAGAWGAMMILLAIASCANTSKNIQQDKKPEKVPIKIEHHQGVTTNQLYMAKQSYLIHVR